MPRGMTHVYKTMYISKMLLIIHIKLGNQAEEYIIQTVMQ